MTKPEPWSLKSVRINGLLGTHDVHWQLDPKVNILGGRNGSGKSTILHALAILLQGAPQNTATTEEIQIHCQALFKSIYAELQSGECIEGMREVKPKDKLGNDSKDSGGETISLTVGCKMDKDAVSSQFAKHIIYINSADQAISAISKLLEKTGNSGRPALTTLDLLLEQALNTRNQLFAQRVSNAIHQGDEQELMRLRELFGRFEKAVMAFMDYTILDTSTLTFAPKSDRNISIRYDRLSTGEKQLLYVLLTVCNTLGESTILLLDEAEMGMHIDWKKKLLRELRNVNPNMQILAATHSPSLIRGWYDKVREVSQLYVKSGDWTLVS